MSPEKTDHSTLPVVRDLGDTFVAHAMSGEPYVVSELLDVRTSLGQLFLHLALVAEEKLSNEENRNYDIEEGSIGLNGGLERESKRERNLENYYNWVKFTFGEEDTSFAEPIICKEVYVYDIQLASALDIETQPDKTINTYFPSFYSPENQKDIARRFFQAGAALSRDLFDKLHILSNAVNYRFHTLIDRSTFHKDSLDSLIEGVDSIIRAFAFFLPEYPSLSDAQDELAKAQEIHESGILNQFSLLLPMGLLADWVQEGVFPRYRLSRDSMGKLILDPRLIKIVNQKKASSHIAPRMPHRHGIGCPVGSHGLKLKYEGKEGIKEITPERTGIDIIAGLYIDYLRHYWNN